MTIVDAHLAVSQIDQWANVTLTHVVDLNCVDDSAPDVVLRPRHLHPSNVGRMKQALDMFLQTEDRRAACCVVAPNTLKSAESVVERMTKHMYLGLVPINKLTIHPNFLRGLHGAVLPQDPGAFARVVISALCSAPL